MGGCEVGREYGCISVCVCVREGSVGECGVRVCEWGVRVCQCVYMGSVCV